MEIEYDIHTISNVSGDGKEREYVKLRQCEAITVDALAQRIEKESTLTRVDVVAALSALCNHAKRELSSGHRFHVPGLGYFSLSAELKRDEAAPDKTIRGNDISLRAINFKPERQFFNDIARDVRFVRAKHTARSAHYTEQQLWQNVCAYLSTIPFINTSDMQHEFGLSKYTARKWLALFVEQGRLVNRGTAHAPIYVKAENDEAQES